MRIHHIAMRTRGLAALESFYASVLGLPVVQRDGARSVWLRAGEALLMLEQADDGEPLVPEGTRELVAFAVHKDDAERYRRILETNEVVIEGETAYTIYFRDPDGRRVGLSHFPGQIVSEP
jgi:catechol 2,3-dioxygenase-like lactoylglutathione lyase family enzyme